MQSTKNPRLLVTGTAEWPLRGTIVEALMLWWHQAGRPAFTLVVERGSVYAAVLEEAIDTDKFAIEYLPPAPSESSRAYRRSQNEVVAGVDHVLAFQLGTTLALDPWLYACQEHGVTHTLVELWSDITEEATHG